MCYFLVPVHYFKGICKLAGLSFSVDLAARLTVCTDLSVSLLSLFAVQEAVVKDAFRYLSRLRAFLPLDLAEQWLPVLPRSLCGRSKHVCSKSACLHLPLAVTSLQNTELETSLPPYNIQMNVMSIQMFMSNPNPSSLSLLWNKTLLSCALCCFCEPRPELLLLPFVPCTVGTFTDSGPGMEVHPAGWRSPSTVGRAGAEERSRGSTTFIMGYHAVLSPLKHLCFPFCTCSVAK